MAAAKSVSDENLVRREIYNQNKFDIVFELDVSRIGYIIAAGIAPGPGRVICKSDGFCILNHNYYIVRTPYKECLAHFVVNFGDAIGKGQKKPSRPS
jgi:hypothetical protein